MNTDKKRHRSATGYIIDQIINFILRKTINWESVNWEYQPHFISKNNSFVFSKQLIQGLLDLKNCRAFFLSPVILYVWPYYGIIDSYCVLFFTQSHFLKFLCNKFNNLDNLLIWMFYIQRCGSRDGYRFIPSN